MGAYFSLESTSSSPSSRLSSSMGNSMSKKASRRGRNRSKRPVCSLFLSFPGLSASPSSSGSLGTLGQCVVQSLARCSRYSPCDYIRSAVEVKVYSIPKTHISPSQCLCNFAGIGTVEFASSSGTVMRLGLGLCGTPSSAVSCKAKGACGAHILPCIVLVDLLGLRDSWQFRVLTIASEHSRKDLRFGT